MPATRASRRPHPDGSDVGKVSPRAHGARVCRSPGVQGPGHTLTSVSAAPSTSPDLGLLLDHRYRVEELIARGGMATVYRGLDERLDRPVALKIMHPHLAADPVFLARFAREARSAGRLAHPHVVPVFDQGEDAGRVYLAMELVEGPTLRAVLAEEGPLTVRESVRIAIGVAEAVRAAHRAGIIHRDIKPENILLDTDGRVRVADFGLARAIGAAQTSATGTLLGTVAYVSPEIVTRGQADERSDLYALGVVLFEMLTGAQPYRGELPVHIAFQHVHEIMPAPSQRVSSVPRELDALVAWCCERSPESRPQDADAVLRVLQDALASLPAAVLDADPVVALTPDTHDVPRVTASLDEAVLHQDSPARVFPWSAGIAGTEDEDATDRAADETPDSAQDPDADPSPAIAPAGPSPREAAPGSDSTDPQDAEDLPGTSTRDLTLRPPRPRRARHLAHRRRRRSRALRLVATLCVVALLVAGAGLGVRWYATEGPGGDRTVPVLAGTTLGDAESALDAQDLLVRTRDTFSDSVPAGHVISAKPAPGSTVKRGDAVLLLVSRGVQTFTVPDVRGTALADARAAIEGAGLSLVEDDPAYDETVPEGSVVSQQSSAAALPAGGEVHVVVSRGPQPVAVPDTVGRTGTDARSALEAQGFTVSTSEAFSTSVAAGSVVSQNPAGGSARRGATVSIVVSKGPEMAAVPDVYQQTEAQATQTLQAAGFQVAVAYDRGVPVFGLVYAQDPAGGGQAPKGSTITIRVL